MSTIQETVFSLLAPSFAQKEEIPAKRSKVKVLDACLGRSDNILRMAKTSNFVDWVKAISKRPPTPFMRAILEVETHR